MKFTIKRNEFTQAARTVLEAINSKNTIPILSGLKLNLIDNQLTLIGSDSDISIETVIDGNSDDSSLDMVNPGGVVVPAKFFSEIIRKLPDEYMTVTLNDNFHVTITSGKSEFNVNGQDVNNYPRLPEIDVSSSLKIDAQSFKKVLRQTSIAVLKQESRPILTGVHFNLTGDSLKAVATDSHRLAQNEILVENNNQADFEINIPGLSLNKLERSISEFLNEVTLTLADNQVMFLFDNTKFYTRLLEGTYPDTDRLISDQSNTSATFEISSLKGVIDRVSLFSHQSNSNVVRLIIKPDESLIDIFASSPELGNVKEEVSFDEVKGENLEISFNPDYVRDALNVADGGNITFNFIESLRPFTLKTDSDPKLIQLITPVRTY